MVKLTVTIKMDDEMQSKKININSFLKKVIEFLEPYGLYDPDFLNRKCSFEWEAKS